MTDHVPSVPPAADAGDRCDLPRRRLLRRAAGCAAFAVALSAGAGLADAQQREPAREEVPRKMTLKEAEYQDEPKGGIMMCLTCTLFLPPAACKVVEGDVAATGWCKAFDMAD